ncbi:MAG: hypothetical protein KF855_05155 [Acidobacteria bacterium]|nr:hypothetical protein [Acidobacteriota bacterium]
MEPAADKIALGQMPIGTRLIVRSKKDWRFAVISRVVEETITISISSPTGYNYRIRRTTDAELQFDGAIPCLISAGSKDTWRDNLARFDTRW